MASDIQVLRLLVDRYLSTTSLTPAERREVAHIAQGFACKDAATADDRAVETIRSRRKRLYAKLRISGASELLSTLLALSLDMLARGESLGVPDVPAASAPNAERARPLAAPDTPESRVAL